MRNVNLKMPAAAIARQFRTSRALILVGLALATLMLLLALAPTVAAQDPTPEPEVYEVQPGDTLFSIAQRFGSSVEAIVAANDIANPSLISVGQKLVIPAVEQVFPSLGGSGMNLRVHPVQPGEFLPALAFRYGTTVWALRADNELGRLGLLWPGLELDIPLPTAEHAGVPGFPAVRVSPDPALQGQTVLVEVVDGLRLEVGGSLLGQDLQFREEEGRYWALAAIHALTAAGSYSLRLEARETESGDLLTLQERFTVTKAGFGTYNVVVPESRQGLLSADLSEAERLRVNAVYAGISDERLWNGMFGPPLDGELRVTAPFGQRRSYNGGPVASYHSGQDLGADKGVAVMAPMTGTVVLAEPLDVRGQSVIIDHGLGVFSGFWHLSRIDVTLGQTVGKGQVIGLVGNTGLSTGPHLHWEMRVLGVPVDPFQWMQVEFPSQESGFGPEPAPAELPTPSPELTPSENG